MREIIVDLGGEELTLAATFKASVEISDRVGDPLVIAREAAIEAMMSQNGVPYDPRWKFSVRNVPEIIWIGAKAAGDKRKLEDVQELVFAAGFIAARDVATRYLAAIVSPTSEEIEESGGDKEPGK